MYVEGRMTKNVVTVTEETTFYEVSKIMKEHGIRHLPVVKGEKVIGMISDRDIKLASPSIVTSFSKGEINYLLDNVKAKDIMHHSALTIDPQATIEEAAKLLHDSKVGSLPVVKGGKIIGIICETDILEAFVEVLGLGAKSTRITLELPDKVGVLADITRTIKEYNGMIISIVSPYHKKEGLRTVVIRIQSPEAGKIVEELNKSGYNVVSVIESNGN